MQGGMKAHKNAGRLEGSEEYREVRGLKRNQEDLSIDLKSDCKISKIIEISKLSIKKLLL